MERQTIEEVKKVILTQLPRLMETEPDIRDFILRVTREQYAGKQETESRFDRIMDELKRDREAQTRKWEDNQKVINEMLAAIKLQNQKYDSTIGALGARWGLHSEAAYRNGLRAILERSFGVKVERYEDYDHDGVVFGRPEQIEMDVIIHDGTLILCEIKSSMSKSDLYSFWRKKNFYEEKHGRRASRAMVISPMIDDYARSAAKELDIEVYGYAEDVKT
jgi:hypothetical protein